MMWAEERRSLRRENWGISRARYTISYFQYVLCALKDYKVCEWTMAHKTLLIVYVMLD